MKTHFTDHNLPLEYLLDNFWTGFSARMGRCGSADL